MVEISIIMPVHNTGAYLEESLASVFSQTFQSFEIICVDDCSDDDITRAVLNKYEAKCSNMTVIRLDKNMGAGESRNIGFAKARGKYVIFLDADDVFREDMLSVMYQRIVAQDADVCMCGYEVFCVQNAQRVYISKCIPSIESLTNKEAEDWFINISQFYAPWNKLCKRQFLLDEDIAFQNISSSNDVFYSCMILRKANNVSVIADALVEYRTNSGTQISSNRNPCDIYKAIELLEEKLEQKESIKRQLFLMRLIIGWTELVACKRIEYQKQAYEMLYTVCKENEQLVLVNMRGSFLRRNMMKDSFREQFFSCGMDFLSQMRVCLEEIRKALEGKTEIYLWGLGKRGGAFQVLCKEGDIPLSGVADKTNDAIGQLTEYGYQIMCTVDVLKTSGVIVASNSCIYDELSSQLRKRYTLVDLEEYCPL